MKNLRAICDAAKWFESDYFHELFGYDYQSTAIYLNTFSPNQVRKLLDVIELQREALELIRDVDKFGGINQYVDIWAMAETSLAESEKLLK